MTDRWSYAALRDIADVLTGYPFKSDLYVSDVGAPRLLRGDNVAQGVIRWNGAKRWAPTPGDKIDPYWLGEGDVVLAMDRPWIEAGLKFASIRETDLPALLVQRVARLRGSDRLLGRFLHYVIASRQFTDYVLSVQTGTAVPHISGNQIRGYEFLVPSLPEQRAIAHILGTLDDKIELNRRMSETLETMARVLFKSWFMVFDPVRAKAEGHDPGLPRPLAGLFPTRLVHSELGEIPEGWKLSSLPEVIEVNPSRSLRKSEIAPYLDMANMPTQGHTPGCVVDRPFGSGMRFMNGDTLVARITPCLENGKVAFVDFLKDGQIGWGSTEYIVLRPRQPLSAEFAYCLARSDKFREFAIQSMTGSSGRQRVPAQSLDHFRLAVSPQPISDAFGRAVGPMFARASEAVAEARTLAALRDSLLPKLISGEIRLRNAEKTVEAVA